MRKIRLAEPRLTDLEKGYVLDCLDSTWISSQGRYLDRFEAEFAERFGVAHAVATSNGTTALHLALASLGVGPGDEVIVPALTFVATVNAISYCGATPVFVDCEPRSPNASTSSILKAITPKTTAIIPVHLYGFPIDLLPVLDAAADRDISVVADAAEALGAKIGTSSVASIGDAVTFSFFGNKVLTTGEGGMVTTNDPALDRALRLYRGHGQDPLRRYWHPVVGFNYRMTNICAAIGLGQLSHLDEDLSQRRAVGDVYRSRIQGLDLVDLLEPQQGTSPVDWLFTCLVPQGVRELLMDLLYADGIETRPAFTPIPMLPPYRRFKAHCPNAEVVGLRGISLPTHPGVSVADAHYVIDRLEMHLRRIT